MPPGKPAHRKLLWVLLALSAFLLFFRLGSYGLIESADARYAETSFEMAASGDLLTPYVNHIKYFRKPPLVYWLTVPGYWLLGHNEWGARVGLGLTGLACLLLTYGLARRMYAERTALLAWLILLSMGGFLGAHRLLTADPLLTLTMTGALYFFWRWQEAEGGRFSHLFFGLLALTFMAKGPVGVALVWLIILSWALLGGRLKLLARLRWGAGLAIFALVGLPWYLYVVVENGGLLHHFLLGQVWRMTGELGHTHRPLLYIPADLAFYCVPWSAFLVVALWQGLRRREGKFDSAKLFLASWVIVPTVFFTLIATKLPNYVMPALPGAAVLVASWWQETAARFNLAGRLAAATLAAALVIFSGLLILRPNIIPGLGPIAHWIVLFGLAAALPCAAAALTSRPWPALAAAAGIMPALLVVVALQVERVPFKTYRPLGVRLAQLTQANPGGNEATVASYKCRVYSLPFYVGRRVLEAGVSRDWQVDIQDSGPPETSPEEFLAAWEAGGRIYCVLPVKRLPDFDGLGYRVLGVYRDKLMLIANQAAAGG